MRTLLAVLTICFTMPVFAADEPNLRAALSKVTGLVRVAKPGGTVEAAAATGQPLFTGDKVITAAGKAEVRFNDGNTIRLSSNASIEIMGPEHPRKPGIRGMFTRLLHGSVRAFVKNLEKDEVFEIHGMSAIASVKGTDMVDDDGKVTVMDEGDTQTHSVEVTDANGENPMTVGEGQTGGFGEDGKPDAPDPTDPALVEQYNTEFNTDIPPPAGSGGETGGGEPQGGAPAPTPPAGGTDGQTTQSEGEDEGGSDLQGEITDQMGADDLANFTDAVERQAESDLGLSLLDRYGNRVRREEYVFHAPGSDTIEYLNVNHRDSDPADHMSSLHTLLQFNQPLPDSGFQDIRRTYRAAFENPNMSLTWWTVAESRTLENADGDRMREEVKLGQPDVTYDLIANTTFFSEFSYQPDWGAGAVYLRWAQDYLYSRFVTPAGGAETCKEAFWMSKYGDVNAGWYAGMSPIALYPVGTVNYYQQSGVKDNQPTDWAANGPTVTSVNLPGPSGPVATWITGSHAMYLTDKEFNSAIGVNVGQAGFNNPNIGSGVRYAYFDASGLGTEATYYGDGTTSILSSWELPVYSDAQIAAGGSIFDVVPEALNNDLDFQSSEFGDRVINVLMTPDGFMDSNIHGPGFNGPRPDVPLLAPL